MRYFQGCPYEALEILRYWYRWIHQILNKTYHFIVYYISRKVFFVYIFFELPDYKLSSNLSLISCISDFENVLFLEYVSLFNHDKVSDLCKLTLLEHYYFKFILSPSFPFWVPLVKKWNLMENIFNKIWILLIPLSFGILNIPHTL